MCLCLTVGGVVYLKMILRLLILVFLSFGCIQMREIASFQEKKDSILETIPGNTALYEYFVDHEKDHLDIHIFINAEARNALSDPASLWADKKIPYQLSDNYETKEKDIILEAMAEFKNRTCIRFEPRRKEETPFIIIEPGSGCSATVGKTAKGKVSLGRGCSNKGIIIHELMHILGFLHEHSRPDRDEYVEINWENVVEKSLRNFKKYSVDEVHNGSVKYDYGSIMHYGTNNFAKNRSIPTIRPLEENVTIGQRKGFSEFDVEKILERYRCGKGTKIDEKRTTKQFSLKPTAQTIKNTPIRSSSTEKTVLVLDEQSANLERSSTANVTTQKFVKMTSSIQDTTETKHEKKHFSSKLLAAIVESVSPDSETTPSHTTTLSKNAPRNKSGRFKRFAADSRDISVEEEDEYEPPVVVERLELHSPAPVVDGGSGGDAEVPVVAERLGVDMGFGRNRDGTFEEFQTRLKEWQNQYQSWYRYYQRWMQEQKPTTETVTDIMTSEKPLTSQEQKEIKTSTAETPETTILTSEMQIVEVGDPETVQFRKGSDEDLISINGHRTKTSTERDISDPDQSTFQAVTSEVNTLDISTSDITSPETSKKTVLEDVSSGSLDREGTVLESTTNPSTLVTFNVISSKMTTLDDMSSETNSPAERIQNAISTSSDPATIASEKTTAEITVDNENPAVMASETTRADNIIPQTELAVKTTLEGLISTSKSESNTITTNRTPTKTTTSSTNSESDTSESFTEDTFDRKTDGSEESASTNAITGVTTAENTITTAQSTSESEKTDIIAPGPTTATTMGFKTESSEQITTVSVISEGDNTSSTTFKPKNDKVDSRGLDDSEKIINFATINPCDRDLTCDESTEGTTGVLTSSDPFRTTSSKAVASVSVDPSMDPGEKRTVDMNNETDSTISTIVTPGTETTAVPFELAVESRKHFRPYHKVRIYRPIQGRTALSNPNRHWPNGVVPYEFSRNYSEEQKGFILDAIKSFDNQTCVRFVPRRGEDTYIFIEPEERCRSVIGRHPGKMSNVSLGEGCYTQGTIIHELMHVLGFVHEQNRPDRDSFIMVMWDNIIPEARSNFEKHSSDLVTTLDVPYDYDSVMHYKAYDFAVNSKRPTLVPLQPGVKLGEKEGFSEKDVLKINILYNCQTKTEEQEKERRNKKGKETATSAQDVMQKLLKYFEMNFQRLFRSILRTIQKFRPIILDTKSNRQ